MKSPSDLSRLQSSHDTELIKAPTHSSFPDRSTLTTELSSQHSVQASSHQYQQRYQHQQSLSQSFSSLMTGMNGAVEVSVSHSTVIFDGTHTHVEAEEQHFQDGQWSQQRIAGTWTGNQSAEAIAHLNRASKQNSRLKTRPKVLRPLPRANKK